MALPHVLSHSGDVTFNLEHYNADQLKKAARFWIGVEAHKLRKAECVAALHKLFRNGSATSAVLASMSKTQQQVLGIFARYGPAVSGAVLSAELHARGLVQDKDPSQRYYGRRNDVVDDLRDKFVLIKSSNAYDYDYSSLSAHRYPDLMVHPALATALPPITPLPWQPPAESPTVQSSYQRAAAAVALDLWQVATGLQALGTWQTVKGGALARGSRNRLHKGVPLVSADQDPLAPPDPESLYYEILRGMRCLSPAEAPSQVLAEALAQHVQQLPDVQAWHWVRAWLDMRLWQDGIGVVPDRDNDYEPVRIDPSSVRKARELLRWALCRVAHSPEMWLDVETFVRKLAFWLADEGVWVAKAVMVTLVHLAWWSGVSPLARKAARAFASSLARCSYATSHVRRHVTPCCRARSLPHSWPATFPRIGLSSVTTKRQRSRGGSHSSGLVSAMYVHYPRSRSHPRGSMTAHFL